MTNGFTSRGAQVSVALLYVLGLTLLTHCLSRKLAVEDVTSWSSIKQISWPRLCIILILVDSWLFLASCAILIFGFDLETSSCTAGIFLCVVIYMTAKILLYMFLIEKVHVVWAPRPTTARRHNPVFLVSFLTVAIYAIVGFVLMVVGSIHYLDANEACVIGLKPFVGIFFLSYDACLNVYLTVMFVWPTLRHKSPVVQSIARRNLVAAIVSLTVSVINCGIQTSVNGQQLGWVCFISCGLDVLINALALFWVTSATNLDIDGDFQTKVTSDDPTFVTRQSLLTGAQEYSDADFHYECSSLPSSSETKLSSMTTGQLGSDRFHPQTAVRSLP